MEGGELAQAAVVSHRTPHSLVVLALLLTVFCPLEENRTGKRSSKGTLKQRKGCEHGEGNHYHQAERAVSAPACGVVCCQSASFQSSCSLLFLGDSGS